MVRAPTPEDAPDQPQLDLSLGGNAGGTCVMPTMPAVRDDPPMESPIARHATIVAVTTEDDGDAKVLQRAAAVARQAGSTVILWAADAAIGPLESPLPTNWSGDGEKEQFGDRLGPSDLIAAGRQHLAEQVGQLREEGVDAWAWLPDRSDATALATYATEQGASLLLLSSADTDLMADLRDADTRADDGRGGGLRGLRVEAVPA
jgi:hypothetical protein